MKYDKMVYIGRFEPPHLAHIQIMQQALSAAEHLIILCGSADQPRTIKNPWTVAEREQMIRSALSPENQNRITVLPLRDKPYNDQLWVRQVQEIVGSVCDDGDEVRIIGHTKDDSSFYLQMFPQWPALEVPNIDDLNATDIRNKYFTQDEDDFAVEIGQYLPPSIHNFLQAFMLRGEYAALRKEHEFIQMYRNSWAAAPYEPTFVTVDAIVIQSGHVLLIRRRAEPGKGLFAIPGGYLNPNERIEAAAIRELKEETKIKVPVPVLHGSIKARQVFDHPSRSLRGRTITHAFLIELPGGELTKVKGSDDADKAKWVPLSVFRRMEDQMFEDHYAIISTMIGDM